MKSGPVCRPVNLAALDAESEGPQVQATRPAWATEQAWATRPACANEQDFETLTQNKR